VEEPCEPEEQCAAGQETARDAPVRVSTSQSLAARGQACVQRGMHLSAPLVAPSPRRYFPVTPTNVSLTLC